MINTVYHFTDTIRLPWIIETGELRPSSNRIGGFPQDPLWATTSDNGDKTSTVFSKQAQKLWRKGALQLIRFTLNGDDFSDWRDVVRRNPDWTNDHIAKLERSARRLGERDTSRWRARREPLSLTRVLAVHAKSCSGNGWMPIEATQDYCMVFEGGRRAFVIAEIAYGATRNSEGYREPFIVPVRQRD
jgi:hypothetical protein